MIQMEQDNENLSTQVHSFDDTVIELNDQIKKLTEQVHNEDEMISRLSGELYDTKNERDILRTKYEDMGKLLEEANNNISSLTQSLDNEKNKVTDFATKASVYRSALIQLAKEIN